MSFSEFGFSDHDLEQIYDSIEQFSNNTGMDEEVIRGAVRDVVVQFNIKTYDELMEKISHID